MLNKKFTMLVNGSFSGSEAPIAMPRHCGTVDEMKNTMVTMANIFVV